MQFGFARETMTFLQSLYLFVFTKFVFFPFQKLFTLDFGESEDKMSPVKSQVSNCDPVTLRNDQFVISSCNVIINIITVKLCY